MVIASISTEIHKIFKISLIKNKIEINSYIDANPNKMTNEGKYLSEEMSEDLNLDEFVKIPNVIEFETTYKNFKENQNFYIISEGTLKRNKNLTEEHFKNFKKEIEGSNYATLFLRL